ncbi:MAG: glutathione-dependent formaldehyde dehydrogenase [Candidatus Eremiobacteraeota bacterium]|nr:glutathione-dependent formaldehyde dehydrogenase [Candidatus Eremiobacteraeota bacterium]
MKALVWHGKHDVRTETVEDPQILNPRDAIVEVTTTAVCGSDLHIYNGLVPGLKPGDILGHEFVGRVVETGSGVDDLREADRVAVPFSIACGGCDLCERGQTSLCANANPNAEMLETMYGHGGGGLFGYSHLYGGYAGGQAQYVRVPFADFGPLKVPEEIADEQAVLLTDVFPTAYMAVENCDIRPGDVVAIWGCGPIGQIAVRCAFMLGAGRVVAIDRFSYRLDLAKEAGAETINHDDVPNILEALYEVTGGRGPDAVIDCVGLEAHGTSADAVLDYVKQAVKLEMDRPHVLREMIHACGPGGRVSVPGVYIGFIDKFPMGAFFGKGLQMRAGQTHVHRYMRPLLERVQLGQIDPSVIVTHRGTLDDAPRFYADMAEHKDGLLKAMMRAV